MSAEPTPTIALTYVSTLPTVPGYTVVRTCGVVAGVGTSSGKTAKVKAIHAYSDAIEQLCQAGASVGANAIVGLAITNFGSSAGGAFGDAVGTALIGTAVVIE